MSYDVERYWFYKKKGRKIFLYQIRRGSRSAPDNQGRLDGGENEVIYPDESITNVLRVEYTAFIKPFVTLDPNSLATDDSETTWTNPTLTEATSPSETSHLNLNKMLSLAVVDYVRAMIAEREGNIKVKEYFMRQFYKKLSDNESNYKNVFVTTVNPVMSVR